MGKPVIALLLGLGFGLPFNQALADEFEVYLGLGAAVSGDALKGQGVESDLIPVIAVEYGPWQFSSLEGASYTMLDNQSISMLVTLDQEASGIDNDNQQLSSVNEPDTTSVLSLALKKKYAFSYIKIALTDEISGEHDGWKAALDLGVEIPVNQAEVSFELSIQHVDQNWVDYFYGVSAGEATTEITAYQGRNTTNYQMQLSYQKTFAQEWIWLSGARLTIFGDGITDSSIVSQDTQTIVFSALAFQF